MLDAARAEARGQVGRGIARGQELLPGSVGPKERAAAQLDRGQELNRPDGPDSRECAPGHRALPGSDREGRRARPARVLARSSALCRRGPWPRTIAASSLSPSASAPSRAQLLPRTILGRETLHHGYTLRAMPRLARRAACWIVLSPLCSTCRRLRGAAEQRARSGAGRHRGRPRRRGRPVRARGHQGGRRRARPRAHCGRTTRLPSGAQRGPRRQGARPGRRAHRSRAHGAAPQRGRTVDRRRRTRHCDGRTAARRSRKRPAPGPQRETMDVGIKAAGKTLQEARTAFEKQSYAQARTAAGVALTQVRETMATLDDADARAKRGAPRNKKRLPTPPRLIAFGSWSRSAP